MGLVLPDNVECGAMCRGGNRNRQATGNSYTTLKSHQLNGDLPLVMIHGDNGVDFASLGFEKNRIGWPGSGYVHLSFLTVFYHRFDYINLLAAKFSVVTRVGVQCCYRNYWPLVTRTA